MEDTSKARIGPQTSQNCPINYASISLLQGHSHPHHQFKKRLWIGKWGRLVTLGAVRRPTPTPPLACDSLDVTLPPPAAVTCLASGFVLFFPEMTGNYCVYCCHRLFPTTSVGICRKHLCLSTWNSHTLSQRLSVSQQCWSFCTVYL